MWANGNATLPRILLTNYCFHLELVSKCLLLLWVPRSVKRVRMVLGPIKCDLLPPGSENIENMQLGTRTRMNWLKVLKWLGDLANFTFLILSSNQKISVTDFWQVLATHMGMQVMSRFFRQFLLISYYVKVGVSSNGIKPKNGETRNSRIQIKIAAGKWRCSTVRTHATCWVVMARHNGVWRGITLYADLEWEESLPKTCVRYLRSWSIPIAGLDCLQTASIFH